MNKIINKNTNEAINYINCNSLDKPIILVGMMGTGKTVIGKMLAKSLNRIFLLILFLVILSGIAIIMYKGVPVSSYTIEKEIKNDKL